MAQLHIPLLVTRAQAIASASALRHSLAPSNSMRVAQMRAFDPENVS